MTPDWTHYPLADAYDELLTTSGRARAGAGRALQHLRKLNDAELSARREAASVAMQLMGITFAVYTEEGDIDRVWPFDIIPRIITATEWRRTDAGLKQRVQALNMFIADIYGRQQIIKDGVFPAEVLAQSANFRPECVGIKPLYGVWAHICGSDLVRVDVIYRRIDDLFLDPKFFNPDSMIGVPGLMRAWAKGQVAIANAPGAGVADDKVVYAFVPKMIRYYLDQDPILNNVPTFLCMYRDQREYVLENIADMVVKPANESGGYGMMVGPAASKRVHKEFAALIRQNPRNYIAQPTLKLSTVPTLCEDGIEPRHVDLRPFILSGESCHVTRGGLTRVALRKGSLVVNSSQGGGSKDTWIVDTGGH